MYIYHTLCCDLGGIMQGVSIIHYPLSGLWYIAKHVIFVPTDPFQLLHLSASLNVHHAYQTGSSVHTASPTAGGRIVRTQIQLHIAPRSETVEQSMPGWQMEDVFWPFAQRSRVSNKHYNLSFLACEWNQWILLWNLALLMPPTSLLLSTTFLVRCWTAHPQDEGCVGPRTPGQVSTPWRGWWRKEKSCRAWTSLDSPIQPLGKPSDTKTDEFSEKFQTAFGPPPSFSENHVADFL